MKALARVAVIAGALALSTLSGAQEMSVPPKLQAALFKKIFDYDRTLTAAGTVRVFVIHDGDASSAGAVARAFRDGGVDAVALGWDEVTARIGEASVVYVTPGVDAGSLEALCTQNGVLSVSGFAELAIAGQVAVGIGTHNQKPEILVHLKRVKAEGHDLAAELLSLARVIR